MSFPYGPRAAFLVLALTLGAGAARADGVESLLPSADPVAGATAAKLCMVCHSVDKGGVAKIGPNLWNVVNRPAGKAEKFAYSPAFVALNGKPWSYANLDAYLTSPKDYAPNTKMAYPGSKDPKERANIIAWLRTLADSPAPLK